MIVADASLIGHAVIRGQRNASAAACRARDDAWVAPPVWRHELVSVLVKHLREPDARRRLTLPEVLVARAVAAAAVHTSDLIVADDDVLRRAFDLRIGGYDAFYVTLAERLGVRVVTTDNQLLIRAAGVCVSMDDFAAGR